MSYRVCLVGCGRMGATIDDEIADPKRDVWIPFSHAAGYAACEQTELVAVCDVDQTKAESIRERYGAERAYTDYREMIREMEPDIVSIATRPDAHADATVFAAENGVRGIYCEKALCMSMAEADRMQAACNASGVAFNYGAQRRYMPLYRTMRELAMSGQLGDLEVTTGCHGGASAAQWGHTHTVDVLMFLAGDPEVDFVQGTANFDSEDVKDGRIQGDPGIPAAMVRFSNGVWGHVLGRSGSDFEVLGTLGALRTQNDAMGHWLRAEESGRYRMLEEAPFPEHNSDSGTLNAIREIVAELDGGWRTSGNIDVACRSQEMIFGILESERRGGARVTLPLEDRSLTVG